MNIARMDRSSYSLMYSLRNTEWTVYSAFELATLLDKNLRAVQKKAVRQEWPYHLISQPGRHKRIYTVVTLPDDIQTKWAALETDKVCNNEAPSKDDSNEPVSIIRPLTRIQAEVALSWPERPTYFKIVSPDRNRGPKTKIYDGISQGLCPAARQILLNRFSELSYVGAIPQVDNSQSLDLIGNQQLLERLLEEKDKRIAMLEHYAEENKRLTHEIQKITDERNRFQREYMELLLLVQENKLAR